MKKIIAILLAVGMMAAFAGCGKTGNAASASDDSWKKVQQAGKLVVGLDDAFPPMGYVDTKTGGIIGFDVDLATEVCARLGITLKLQPIDWDNKQMEVDNGNVDCLWNGFSKTPEREESFNLSTSYMQNNQIILVKQDATYKNLADLKGKTLGVQADSSAEDALNKSVEFKSSLKSVVSIDDYAKAVMEIKNGTIDAIAIDEVVARFYMTNEPGAYRILNKADGTIESLAKEDYVVGFRKADDALKAKIEETLKAMAKDGKLAEISKKWFGEDVTTIGK